VRTYDVAILTAALFVLPTSAFSQVGAEIGPGGVYVGYRQERYYGGARCRELRQACLPAIQCLRGSLEPPRHRAIHRQLGGLS
jgi:hypothetical protein